MPSLNRNLRITSLVAAAAAIGAAGTWAATTVLAPREEALAEAPFTLVATADGLVGASITLNSVAEWKPAPAGTNLASGIVTSVDVAPGDTVDQGDVLYHVGLRPVVIANGSTPAFRDIGLGATGDDVAQLQEMLAATGHYTGIADGKVEAGTAAAISHWQKSLGLAATGTVGAADVIFVPELPARVALDAESIERGAALTGGEPAVQALPSAPEFQVPIPDGQSAMMPTGTAVEITSPDGDVWKATVRDQVTDPDTGARAAVLEGSGGAPICGDGCGQLPIAGETLLTSRIITAPEVAGLAVPSAALVSDAAGVLALVDASGTRHAVTVVASAKGMSIIEGVKAGLKVRVPGDAKTADESSSDEGTK